MEKKLIIFTDIGDTVIDEGTQKHLAPRVIARADCIPGAKEALLKLHEEGYAIAMVADGKVEAFTRMMRQHGLDDVFATRVISDAIGESKPSPKMFQTAMDRMGLTDADKYRVIMIGNNIERDIKGANRFGIRSVLINWSPRYKYVPHDAEEVPQYTVTTPAEIPDLVHRLEAELESDPA